MTVAILVPVLARPKRARPLYESVRDATPPGQARIVFLCSPGDDAEIKACRKVKKAETIVVPFDRAPGDYSRKVNYGVSATEEPWLFQGADDLRFHSEWLSEALRAALDGTGRRVVGTNDLGNRLVVRGRHSTHSLVHRSYIEEVGTGDEPGKLLHEGYHHNFCDTELIQGAMWRHEYVHAAGAIVEHLHPHWKKGDMDATYRLGLSEYDTDRRLFMARRRIWRAREARGGRAGGVG